MLAYEFARARIKAKLFTQSIVKVRVSDSTLRWDNRNKRKTKQLHIEYKFLQSRYKWIL